jgi:uncharacterized protein (TIGR00251 family)
MDITRLAAVAKVTCADAGGTGRPLSCLETHADGALSLFLHVQPKSSINRIAGLHGQAIKLCITAPPVDGKANEAIIRFIARLLKIPRANVALGSGETSRGKRLVLTGIQATEVEAILRPLLAGGK